MEKQMKWTENLVKFARVSYPHLGTNLIHGKKCVISQQSF